MLKNIILILVAIAPIFVATVFDFKPELLDGKSDTFCRWLITILRAWFFPCYLVIGIARGNFIGAAPIFLLIWIATTALWIYSAWIDGKRFVEKRNQNEEK